MKLFMMTPSKELDVLIVGAGISGIGTASYLKKHLPGKRFEILESRSNLGGTWDLFRYPGIRSDSDLYTFGYEFKPWKNKKAIADGKAILDYLHEAVSENGLEKHIRYRYKVVAANWRSDKARWEVSVENTQRKESLVISCKWLFCAGGYYNYDEGFAPKFSGQERFAGPIIHPQHWPESIDYTNKNVIVIGSGATAVTLVPALAKEAAHVTMLQRTPSYVMSLPAVDPIAIALHKVLPARIAHALTRRKNISLTRAIWRFCQRYPGLSRRLIRSHTQKQLPADFPVDIHFNPPYDPWDQRLCAAPDGDFFKAISNGKASVVTDHIDSFTEHGVCLKSGHELDADIIVTATGLNIRVFGGIRLSKDFQEISLPESIAYKGSMLSGIPNFSFAVGYTNSSWTLKVGLLSEHFCRLLSYMDDRGYAVCQPEAPRDIDTRPLLDFGAGYIQRAMDGLPRQGPGVPWVMSMDYFKDVKLMRKGTVENKALRFEFAPALQMPDRFSGYKV